MRTVAYGGARVLLKGRFFVTPNILYMNHHYATDFLFGANFGYNVNTEIFREITVGPYFRGSGVTTTDAVIAAMFVRTKWVDVGVSYDFNISALSEYTGNRGAFEISLIYKSVSTKVFKTSVPCERF
jgi:hypothetical protein